jgi:hypothetical protein
MRETITLGAAREHLVIFDLQMKGFCVYPAGSAHSPHDLKADKYGFTLKVEVKGEHKAPLSGPLTTTPKGSHNSNTDCRKFDILAVADEHTRQVRYMRSALHVFNKASKELVGEEVRPSRVNKCILNRVKEMENVSNRQRI